MSTVAEDRRALARSGIPVDPDLSEPLPKRLLRSRMFWLTLIMLGVYLTLLILLYRQVVPDQQVPGGTVPGLGTEAIPLAAEYAAMTAIPLSLVSSGHRYRPRRIWVWMMTFGWGDVWPPSSPLRSTRGPPGHRSIVGDGDPATGPRARSTLHRSLKKRRRPPSSSGWRS